MAAAAQTAGTAALAVQSGMALYLEDLWLDAAAAFARALEVDNTKPQTYEYKVRCHIHQSRLEMAEFAQSATGPDGSASSKLAYDTAWRVVQKFGTTRWESLWVLAEAACLVRQYGIVGYILTQITEHPSYKRATPAQKAAVESHAKRHEGRGGRSCRTSSRRPVPTTPADPAIPPAAEPPSSVEKSQRQAISIENAFSPDTLLRVVDLAKGEDVNVAIRMSGVCRRWRGVLVNQPGCWQRLTLGPGAHTLDKARTFLQRCRGNDEVMETGLKELDIHAGFNSEWVEELGEMLAPHAPYVQTLNINIRPGDARVIYAYLHHGLRSARRLHVEYGATASLDYGLLPTDQSKLQSLTLGHISHDNPRDRQDEVAAQPTEMTTWVEAPDRQLAELTTLAIENSYFSSPISSLNGILQHTPKLARLSLSHLTWWKPPSAHFYHQASAGRATLRLEHLNSWSMDSGRLPSLPSGYIPFQTISVPNLTYLELVGVWAPTETLSSAGLVECLPSLRTLILGKTTLHESLFDILRSTSAVEFLCLTHANLSPAFLDRFSKETTTAPHLLPNLVALSLAGNIHVRTRYLREFLNGRAQEAQPLPKLLISGSGEAGEGNGGDGGAPDGDVFGPVIGAEDSSPEPLDADPVAPEAADMDKVEVASSVYAETVPPPVTRIRWLNIDHCTTVDARYLPKFQEKVQFVSHWMGAPDEDRIRGKGKWDWEKISEFENVFGEIKAKAADKRERVGWYGERYIDVE